MPTPLDLVVDPGDFPLEYVAVSLLALLADLLVAVGARVDVSLF